MYSFPDLEPVCCSMSRSNCCFLTCIQISQEAGQVSGIPILFKNFPEFLVIHTVKGFGIVNKAEVDLFFWNSIALLMIQCMLAIWSMVPLPSGKLSSGHRTGKGQFSFQSQRKAMPKYVQMKRWRNIIQWKNKTKSRKGLIHGWCTSACQGYHQQPAQVRHLNPSQQKGRSKRSCL